MVLLRTWLRSLYISVVLGSHGLIFACRCAALGLRGAPAEARADLVGQTLLLVFGTLGATFIKVAQYLSTRPDLIPDDVARGLQQLQDRVEPFPYSDVRRILLAELHDAPEQIFAELDPYPEASASVAQVHRGVLLSDGSEVAVKILRPDIERVVALDLSLMRLAARLLNLIPSLRILALVDVVDEFAEAIQQQVDLRIEATNNLRFAENFALDEEIAVPRLVPDLCTRRVMCMEFIRGEKILGPQRDDEESERLARAGFSMLLKMVFIHGFVHADLHPGNLFVAGDRLVMLDLGLVARLTPAHRATLMQLFQAWLARDATRICEVMLRLLEGEPPAAERLELLHGQVTELLERYSNLSLSEVSMGQVMLTVLRLMRQHQLRVQPALTMVILSMGVVEGVGRQLAPHLDLAQEAMVMAAGMGAAA